MYKLAIVDDEPVIRFGIGASVDWESNGLRLAGMFANGQEAWELLEQEPVDILITDIKMPVMDGLELTRLALQHHKMTKVILVSSYNDFEYVRAGLKLGVADYLLKPTLEPESLLELVKKCMRQLEEERKQATEQKQFTDSWHLAERRRNEAGLKRALSLEPGSSAQWQPPALLQTPYAVAAVSVDGAADLEQQHGSLYISLLLEEMQEEFYSVTAEGYAFPAGPHQLLLLLPQGGLAGNLHKLRENWLNGLRISTTTGVGTGTSPDCLKEAYAYGLRAAGRKFWEGPGVYYKEPGDWHPPEPGPAVPQLQLLLQELKVTAVTGHDPDGWKLLLDACLDRWRKLRLPPDRIRKEACETISTLFGQDHDMSLLLEEFEELKQSETLEHLGRLLESQIQGHAKAIVSSPLPAKGNRQLIDKAIDFIAANYTHELTLQQAADHVHMSKNYFCLLFKKFTGQNFIDYVIRLRIAKAKELLTVPGLKIYEVAEGSGFGDVKYFSKLFKKMTGCSPVEYRDRSM
ncbi:response regulator [Paenibacillus gansuensis]|uniref:Response regulator n=1 Tax=Paenibacillus gansuensis TaxID=306542 RepID=A0ABW5PL82_9BACL